MIRVNAILQRLFRSILSEVEFQNRMQSFVERTHKLLFQILSFRKFKARARCKNIKKLSLFDCF